MGESLDALIRQKFGNCKSGSKDWQEKRKERTAYLKDRKELKRKQAEEDARHTAQTEFDPTPVVIHKNQAQS